MTDPSDPISPPPRKPRPTATIDLDATRIEEGPTPAEAERRESERELLDEEVAAHVDSGVREDPGPAEAQPIDAEALAAAEAPRAPPQPPPAPRTGGLLAAGLIGGIVGAALALGIAEWRMGRSGDGNRLAALESRMSASAPQDAVRALQERVEAVRVAQTALAQKADAAVATAARAEAAAAARPPVAAAAQSDPQALADLSSRLSALEGPVREGAEAAAAVAKGAATAVQGLERTLGDGERRLAGLEQRIGSESGAAARLGERVTDLDQRLGTLTRKVAEEGSDTARAGTRIVLSARLLDAVRDGSPYAETLAAMQRVGTDSTKLQALEPFARTGAPTAASLADSFGPVQERILQESRPAGGAWTDRLARMAERVVSIRAVDDPSGTSVPTLLSRIESNLRRGAVAGAAAAFAALPEGARTAAGDWGRKLEARAAAEAAARALSAEAIASLTPATR